MLTELVPTVKELKRLPRWFYVALVARHAFRLMPLLKPDSSANGQLLIESAEACATLAAIAATKGRREREVCIKTRTLFESAFSSLHLSSGPREESTAAFFKEAVRLSCYDIDDTSISPDVFPIHGEAQEAIPEIRADYERLTELAEKTKGNEKDIVPLAFFQSKLWSTQDNLPLAWRTIIELWGNRLYRMGLQDVYSRYSSFLFGAAGFDPDAAASRVDTWISQKLTHVSLDLFMLSDKPVTSGIEDRLGFADYANVIAALIRSPQTETPLTIAINGPWGTGKSSLAHMIKARLEDPDNSLGSNVVCWFNAWLNDDASDLATAFAAEVMRTALKNGSWWRKLSIARPSVLMTTWGRIVNRIIFGAVFFIIVVVVSIFLIDNFVQRLFLQGVGPALKLIEDKISQGHSQAGLIPLLIVILATLGYSLLKIFEAAFSGYLKEPQRAASLGAMSQFRSQLGALIERAVRNKERFVVFVDELDRCRPPRALDVLEVVNQLLDHKKVVTVLICDLNTVSAMAGVKYAAYLRQSSMVDADRGSFSQRQGQFGRRFLQKIIQLQFDLPVYRPRFIQRLIDEESIPDSSLSAKNHDLNTLPSLEMKSTFIARLMKWVPVGSRILVLIALSWLSVRAWLNPGVTLSPEDPMLLISVGILLLGFWVQWAARYNHLSWRRQVEQRILPMAAELVKKGLPREKLIQEVERNLNIGLGAEALVGQALRIVRLDHPKVVREAVEEAAQYLTTNLLVPRNVKRISNHIRLLWGIAIERGLERNVSFSPRHIGKWVALKEIWPEVAATVSASCDLLEELENMAGDGSIVQYIKDRFPGIEANYLLERFFGSQPKLSPFVESLIYLEG